MTASTDRWALARHRLADDASAVVLLWATFAVFVFAMTAVVAAFRPIEVSGWEVGSQIPRWFIGGIGIYLTAVYLPMYVAHGYTRRECGRQLPVASLGAVVLLSLLMTLGYAIERGIYAVAGWRQELMQSHLFDTPTAFPIILVEFLLLFTVWMAAGALVGAAVYRGPEHGLYAIPVGIVLVGLAEAVLNTGSFEVLTAFLGDRVPAGDVSLGVSVAVTGGAVALTLPLTWLLVRDLPLRNPSG